MNAPQPQAVHPLPVLYDLVTSMLVPHIRTRTTRAMWPVDPLPADTGKHSRAPRVFRNDAGKVVTALRDVALQTHEVEGLPLAVSLERYAMGYFVELVFQRFLAWAVHYTTAAESRRSDTSHFKYRNGAANARAILAMPLLCDLYHQKLRVYIQQGNFGYMAAKTSGEQQWIYPHLDHYLDTVYHPWVPLKRIEIPAGEGEPAWRAALRRGIARSKLVAGEIWELLRGGRSLWLRAETDQPEGENPDSRKPEGDRRRPLSVLEVMSLFEDRPGSPVSPFVRQTVLGRELALGDLWAPPSRSSSLDRTESIGELFRRLSPVAGMGPDGRARLDPSDPFGSELEGREPAEAKQVWQERLTRELTGLFTGAEFRIQSLLDRFLPGASQLFNVAESEIDYALFLACAGGEPGEDTQLVPPACNRGAYRATRRIDLNARDGARSLFCEFVRWRMLEESLRLFADRMFLHHRLTDPPVTRPADLSRLRDRGLVVVLVPEIHLNLCMDDQLREPCLPLICAHPGGEEQKNDRPKHCQRPRTGLESISASEARKFREIECRDWILAAQSDYRRPDEGERGRAHFWGDGRYPFHALFETLLVGDPTRHTAEDFLMARTLAFLVPPPAEANKPVPAAKADPAWREYAERFRLWIRPPHEELSPDDPRVAFARHPLKGLAGREGWIADEKLPGGRGQAAWAWLRWSLEKLFPEHRGKLEEITFDELWRVEWPQAGNDEGDERPARDFFALGSFWAVNVAIFRALGGFGPSESLLNVRLLAPERQEHELTGARELNDFADFIGTFVEQTEAAGKSAGPRELPFWREINDDTWTPDLLRLKLLIRILGTSLVNLERSREWRNLAKDAEKERLRDLTRTLLHGYQKTASNFPLMVTGVAKIKDKTERERWGRFVRFVLEGHLMRIVSVDAGLRRLMERDNSGGFFQQCLKSILEAQRDPWRLFLAAIAHGCLLGYAARLVQGGLREARRNAQGEDIDRLVTYLTSSRYNATNPREASEDPIDPHLLIPPPTAEQARETFRWMERGICGLPPIRVTGVERAAEYELVLPANTELADRMNTCWTLIFAEMVTNMLGDAEDTDIMRSIQFRFQPEPVRIDCSWVTSGLRLPERGPLALLGQAPYANRWVRPIRPGDESGGGWGHYGNVQFIEDIMGPDAQTPLAIPEQHEFRYEPVEGRVGGRPSRRPPQSYQIRWEPTSPERGTLTTHFTLTAPSVAVVR